MQANQRIIKLNGEDTVVPPGATIASALSFLNIHDVNGLAVAVNENVVPRKNWETFEIPEKADLLLIRATQGG